MKRAVETLFHWGPLVFAVGFLWPLIAQVALKFGASEASTWIASGGVALVLGAIAQWRGRWI